MPDEADLNAPEQEAPETPPTEGEGVEPSPLDLVEVVGLDYVPPGVLESFVDPETKALRLNALGKALSDTQAMAREKNPGAPEKYERNLPEALVPIVDGEEDPLLMALETSLHASGAPQGTYDAILAAVAEIVPDVIAGQPSAESRDAALEPVYGTRSAATVEAVERFAEQLADTEEQKAKLTAMLRDPDHVQILNRARNLAKRRPGVDPTADPATPRETPTEEWQRLMASPEFEMGDAQVQARVSELTQQLDAEMAATQV